LQLFAGKTSMLDSLKTYLEITKKKKGAAYIGLVHRLDRPCSGVVVFAKTSKAAARLSESFRNRTVEKNYVCVVNGYLQGRGELKHSIKKTTSSKVETYEEGVHPKSGTVPARLCYTQLNYLEVAGGKENGLTEIRQTRQTLLHIKLETGRKHQIRAQLKHIGHPIVGDVKYGAPQSFADRSIALHACSLIIEHPITHEKMCFSAPAPVTWKKWFGQSITESVNDLIRTLS
jgi:23S rRNA pseudouridine1911/1915/1917 synthase